MSYKPNVKPHRFNRLIRYISLLCLLCCAPCTFSQVEAWYTSDRALSSSLIKKIIHDRNDIIWIATENGLNRFDGSKFTTFHNIPGDDRSLANEFVNSVFESSDGTLYVCTHNGVQIFNDATQRFSPPLSLKDGDRYTGAVSDMLQLANGEIWTVGTSIMRVVGTPGNQKLERVPHAEDITFVHRGIADHSNNVWLSRSTPGIIRISPDGAVREYLTGPDAPAVESFAIGHNNTLFAGTIGDGIYRYDHVSDSFEKLDLHSFNNANVMAIYPDENGFLLLATDGKGLVVYNLDNGAAWASQIPNVDYRKLKVHSLDKDLYGNLWVGVYQKGMLKVPERSAFFSSINQRNNSNLIGSSCVTTLFRDKDQTLWIGTDNDGVYAVNRWMYSSRHFDKDVPQVVMAIHEDSKGNLWIGSYGDGAGILDKESGVFHPVKMPGAGIDASKIYDITNDVNGNLLIATMGDGIYRYNMETAAMSRIGNQDTYNAWVTSIEPSSTPGKILAGTYDGLYIIESDGSKAEQLLGGTIVNTVKNEPLRNIIWAGTNHGLLKIGADSKDITTYDTYSGLPGKSVYAIEDDGRYLWVSTNHGLSRFDPVTATFTNFTVDDGLPNNEFSKDASFRDSQGNMFFGGINGITSFHPSNITAGGRKLTLRITDFFLAGNPINAGMQSGSRTIIDVPVYEADVFRLSHNDNTFSIRFNTKEMVDGSTSEYFYSFDSSAWTKVTETNELYGGATLTFTNVPPGRHTLRIKAIDDGVESDELAVEIDIASPWYWSWWMKTLYLLLALLLVLWIWRMQLARNRRRRAEMLRHHNSEIMEAKLKFFTDISHEIRTPLSLVLGPVQKLIATDNDSERRYSYQTISRNAKRILRLVNELMDLRKIDNNQMKLRYTQTDMVSFINDLYETFLPAAQEKGIEMSFDHQGIDKLDVWVDRSNFDKILMNLLSNAIKFTPSGGNVTISLTTGKNDSTDGPLKDFFAVTVTDTGIGIEKNDKESVFNRFFQARNDTVTGGTGIGLHLTRQLVELHNGEISVDDNPAGKGTRFTVRIPLGDAHIPENSKTPVNVDTAVEESTASLPSSKAITLSAIEDTPPEDATTEEMRPRHKETVYIVEDDKEILKYIADNLDIFYKTYTFSNGREALDAMHTRKPDLVITDVMMPEMDGLSLTRKIKQNINLNHIPVIILTAKTREEDNIEALESGAAAFITKPFNIDVLIKTAENLIESNQRLRNVFSGKQTQEDKMQDIKVMSNDEKLLERVMREINKNLSNSDITVEMIAKNIGISRVHLHRKLKELTNQSTRDFIRNIRLQTAAKILREKKLSVAEVSDMVGFKQPNNFSTCFKEMFGMSPTAYCAKHHQNPPSDE